MPSRANFIFIVIIAAAFLTVLFVSGAGQMIVQGVNGLLQAFGVHL